MNVFKSYHELKRARAGFNHYPEKASELVEAGKRLVMSSWTLLDSLREEYSEDAVAKATEVLEQAAKKIEEITEKLKE